MVIRSVNGHSLQPPFPTTLAVEARIEGSEVTLTYQVRAANARAALEEARARTRDLMLVLATSFGAYEIVVDERQVTRRTDAVYQSEGAIPPLDVAEGYIPEAGAESLDPTGEARRAGMVITMRAEGYASSPAAPDSDRWSGRAEWPERLRLALGLYHAGQCTTDLSVRFLVSISALEVLAAAGTEELLAGKLLQGDRRTLLQRVRQAVGVPGLTAKDQGRLVSRLRDTQEKGISDALSDYLASKGQHVAAAELRTWQEMRGAYVHDGITRSPDARNPLILLVGGCLRQELDDYR